MSEKPNGHAASDTVGDSLVVADAVPLSDSIEAAQGAIILRSQLTELQIMAARKAERATIEALTQDAKRRYVEALQKGDHRTVVEATCEIIRYEVYLSRRGLCRNWESWRYAVSTFKESPRPNAWLPARTPAGTLRFN
jgi:hypothetical protein